MGSVPCYRRHMKNRGKARDVRSANSQQTGGRIVAIDLFCGAGGLAYGLKEAGIDVAAGVDMDPRCRFPIEENCGAKFYERDVVGVSANDIKSWFGSAGIRVLAGCAPCQPFSTYTQSRKSQDSRWELLRSFQRLAVEALPDVVTMENVTGLASHSVWSEFVGALEAAKYHVKWAEVRSTDFGVPQKRKRLVLLASRLGPIALPTPTHQDAPLTVKDVISWLPPIAAGQADKRDRLHVASKLSATNMQRIKASSPGGTWRDWAPGLRADCHQRETGATYPAVYGRMEWNKPAPTITTQFYGFGNGRFGHPEQDRALSIREAAILQSFPPDYRFLPDEAKVAFRGLGILIGNAVPPKLAQAIGATIRAHVEEMC